jgi:hypothetical protein
VGDGELEESESLGLRVAQECERGKVDVREADKPRSYVG